MSKPINLLGYKNISAGNLIKKLDIRSKSWKKRALYYQKEKRYLQNRVRDLERSKLKIKERNKFLESKLLTNELSSEESFLPDKESIKGSNYPYWQVETSILWYLQSSIGFRALGKGWSILSSQLPIESPSYGVVRQWVLRLGLYKLEKEVTKADDWVYIIDYSIQMGTEYCLVILGFRIEEWRRRTDHNLKMSQIQVLDLVVTEHPTGEQVRERLNVTMSRTGVPIQIVADGGRNIGKGQQLWKEDIGDIACVISTYDVSHLTGCLLKKLLTDNEQWKGLTKELNSIQKRNQQSYAGFIAPLSLRKTARYMNLYGYADYLEKFLVYEQTGDFKLLARRWKVNMESVNKDTAPLVVEQIKQLEATSEKELIDRIKQNSFPIEDLVIEHDGKQEFESRFGGLMVHKPFILVILTLIKWIRCIQQELKSEGLSKKLVEKWKNRKPQLPEFVLEQFWQPLIDRLTQQVDLLPDEQIYLATSDVIESLFGQYKSKVSSYWLKGMSALVLMMPALTGQLDKQIIQQALEKVKIADVEKWFESQRSTASFLSKRKKALPAIKKNKEKPKPQHQVVHRKLYLEQEEQAAA